MGMADKQIYSGLNRGSSERLRRIFRLMQTGKVDPTPMTTHEFGFDEIERAFRMMESKEEGIIKPLIHFDEATHWRLLALQQVRAAEVGDPASSMS
jgi:isopropanol dehydrogenase (NADP+)